MEPVAIGVLIASMIAYHPTMTSIEIRKRLLAPGSRNFSVLKTRLLEQLGEPDEIKMLSGLSAKPGFQVVLMYYKTDTGRLEVFCPVGIVDGQETVVDGWIGAEQTNDDQKSPGLSSHGLRGVDHLKSLFDE